MPFQCIKLTEGPQKYQLGIDLYLKKKKEKEAEQIKTGLEQQLVTGNEL